MMSETDTFVMRVTRVDQGKKMTYLHSVDQPGDTPTTMVWDYPRHVQSVGDKVGDTFLVSMTKVDSITKL